MCRMAPLISDSLVLKATRETCAVAHGETNAATSVRDGRESLTDAR